MRTLETPRLILRPLLPEDEALYCSLYTDPQVMRHIAEPLTPAAAVRAFARTLECNRAREDRYRCWSIVRRHAIQPIGLIGLRSAPGEDRCGVGEIGVMLAAGEQGNGYAREAVRAVSENALVDGGTQSVMLAYMPDNLRMANLASDLGFSPAPAGSQMPEPHRRYLRRAK